MKEIHLLWVDQEHPEIWSGTIKFLERKHGFRVLMVDAFDDENILNNCEGKEAIIVHCGTYKLIKDVRELLENVKNRYPNIKIGLETNAFHPDLEDVADFYIEKPIDDDELQQFLKTQVAL